MTGRCLLAAATLLIIVPLSIQGDSRPLVDKPKLLLASDQSPLRPSDFRLPIQTPGPIFTSPGLPGQTGPVNLRKLMRSAGIIFSGTVVGVARQSQTGPNPAATTITFQVNDAIRGVSVHQVLTVHEWGGLWQRGERYRMGERVILFLHSPSKLGFTSPVGGEFGRFRLDFGEMVRMNPWQALAFAQDFGWPGARPDGQGRIHYADFARAAHRLADSIPPGVTREN